MFEIRVDEQLFISRGFECTPDCIPIEDECPTLCDYTSKENCGVFRGNSSTECECEKKDLCLDDAIVIEEFGKEYGPYQLNGGIDLQWFTFFLNLPCHGYWLYARETYGSTLLNPFFGVATEPLQLVSIWPDFVMCPKDEHYKYGTVQMVTTSFEMEAVEFYLKIEVKDFGKEKVEPKEPTKCEKDNFGAYCLEDSVPTGITSLGVFQFAFYRIEITECRQFLVRREITRTDDYLTFPLLFFGMDKPSTQPSSYFLHSGTQLAFGFCPPSSSNSSFIYLTMGSYAGAFSFILTVTGDSSKWKSEKLSSFGSHQAYRFLWGESNLICPNKEFGCMKGSDLLTPSCTDHWTSVPLSNSTALWPRPRLLLETDSETFANLPFLVEEKVEGDRLVSGFMFEMVGGTQNIEPLDDWENSFQECELVLQSWSPITNQNGEIVSGEFPVELKEGSCKQTEFSKVSKEIDERIGQMKEETEASRVIAARYHVDIQTFRREWQTCEKYIQSALTKESRSVEYHNTKACPPVGVSQEFMNKDSCCNQTLGWTQCCSERTLVVEEERLIVSNPLKFDSCDKIDDQCVKTWLEDYIFYFELQDSISGCSSAIQETLEFKNLQSLKVVKQCKLKFFGKDGKGKQCQTNGECFGETTCDSFRGVCVYQNEEQRHQVHLLFFQCIEEGVSTSVIEFLFERYDFPKDSDFVELCSQNYLIDQCASDVGRALISFGVQTLGSSSETVDCNFVCFDDSCVPPLRCEESKQYGREGLVYPYVEAGLTTLQQTCVTEKICNWNPNIQSLSECVSENNNNNNSSETTSLDSEWVCLVCESPHYCSSVKVSDEEECGNGFCLLNGVLVENLTSKEECEKKTQCSLTDCGGQTCQTEQQCLSNGICSDIEMIEYLRLAGSQLGKYSRFENYSETGYCVSEMKAWNYPDCGSTTDKVATIPTPNGCLEFRNKKECTLPKYKWVELSTSQSTCEGFKTCVEPQIPTELTSPKNEEQCHLCSSEHRNTFTWTPGVWKSGEWRVGKWEKKQMIQTKEWGEIIDFSKLSDDIKESNTLPYSFELQTEAECRLNSVKTVMEQILCLCENSQNDLDFSQCFEESSQENNNNNNNNNTDQNFKTGIGQACAGDQQTLIAPPAIIRFDEKSIKESCILIQVENLLSSEIKTPHSPSISISFRKEKKVFDNVKNQKGAFVGKMIGNGASLEVLDGLSDLLINFTVCLVYFDDELSSEYSVFDFGQRISDEEVRPLSLEQVEPTNDGRICSTIEWKQQNTEKQTFYPIVRVKDWENQGSEENLSSSEKAVFGLMFAFYLMLIVFQIGQEYLEGRNLKNPKRWVGWLMFCCLFVRIVYFGMMLDNKFSSDETSLDEFLLIEIPTYFFFLAILMATIIWGTVGKISSTNELVPKVIMRFSIGFVITMIFIICIIISWDNSGESDSSSCGGRVVESADTSTREAISVVYRVVISVASIGLSLMISYFGGSVFFTLKKSVAQNVSTSVLQNKIYRVTIVSTVSLVLQSIFFIVYSTSVEQSYEWILVLLLIEEFPILLILLILSTVKHGGSKGSLPSKPSTKETGSKESGSKETGNNSFKKSSNESSL